VLRLTRKQRGEDHAGQGFCRRLGGVNHCSLHCRLAKFREFMNMGKHGAVIG
jgi:hypothetical protein